MNSPKNNNQEKHRYIDVLSSNINAISSLAATIRGTLGPKGLDVMLIDQYGDYSCTNDGVEILSKIEIKHPAAKLAIEVAKAQENKVGDGTTTATILTESILTEALMRVKSGIPASKLIQGIELAGKEVIKELKNQSQQIKGLDDPQLLALSKISARGDHELASLLVKAAQNIKDLDQINLSQLIKAYPETESRIIDGILIKKKSHFNYAKNFKDAHSLVIEGAFDPEAIPPEAVKTDEGVKKFSTNVDQLMEAAKRIVKAGIKAIFVDASIFPSIEEYFAKENIFVLTQLHKEDLKSIALSTGSKLITRQKLFEASPEEISKLAGTASEINFAPELNGIIVKGQKFYLPNILVSAETNILSSEKERIAIDAARALEAAIRSGYVLGEGIAELKAAKALDKIHETNQDLADGIAIVEASLKALFVQITANAGYDANEYLGKIQGKQGLDLDTGSVIDLEEAGILDPLEVKINAIKIASEIASQILKINLVIQAKNI